MNITIVSPKKRREETKPLSLSASAPFSSSPSRNTHTHNIALSCPTMFSSPALAHRPLPSLSLAYRPIGHSTGTPTTPQSPLFL